MTVQNPMMQFLVKLLSKNPGDSFAACRQACKARGFTLYPISYGRAKVLAGLIKPKPRGTGERARANRGEAEPHAVVPLKGGKRNAGASAPANQRGDGAWTTGKVSAWTRYVIKSRAGRPCKHVDPAPVLEGLKAKILHLTSERDQARQALRQIRELAR